jgi:hypothetical protein
MKDSEKIKELVKLSAENPELDIIPMAASELCADDDHQYWMGSIGRIQKDIFWHNEETVYVGEDKISDQIRYNFENDADFEDMPDDEFNLMIEKEIENRQASGEIKEAIIVYIELP